MKQAIHKSITQSALTPIVTVAVFAIVLTVILTANLEREVLVPLTFTLLIITGGILGSAEAEHY